MTELVYDETYFHGNRDGYDDYYVGIADFGGNTDTLLARAAAKGFSLAGRPILVLGCAFGYGVQELLDRGANACGMDISAYAISQAAPSLQSRLMVGDARTEDRIRAAKQLVGLRTNQRFDCIVTEDLLPCFTDADIVAALPMWRKHAGQLLHRISIGDYSGGYTLHTMEEWRAIVGQSDWLYEYTRWTEG